MVLCAIAAACIVGPYFFEENKVTLTVNSEHYLDMLQNFLIPEVQHRNMVFADTISTRWSNMPYYKNCYAVSEATVGRENIISQYGNVSSPPHPKN